MGRFDTLGKLVSAHRAWRPTPRGGGVSGGRQWAGGGPPAWCVTLHGQCATIWMMPLHIFTIWHWNLIAVVNILDIIVLCTTVRSTSSSVNTVAWIYKVVLWRKTTDTRSIVWQSLIMIGNQTKDVPYFLSIMIGKLGSTDAQRHSWFLIVNLASCWHGPFVINKASKAFHLSNISVPVF